MDIIESQEFYEHDIDIYHVQELLKCRFFGHWINLGGKYHLYGAERDTWKPVMIEITKKYIYIVFLKEYYELNPKQ